MPFNYRHHERPQLHESKISHIRVGSLISHSHHATPLIMTPTRSADGKKRLAVSLGGNPEWLDGKEKAMVFARASSHQLIMVGAGLNASVHQDMLEKRKRKTRKAKPAAA